MNIYKKRVIHDKNGHAYADKSINENFRLHTEESGIRILKIVSKKNSLEKIFLGISQQIRSLLVWNVE